MATVRTRYRIKLVSQVLSYSLIALTLSLSNPPPSTIPPVIPLGDDVRSGEWHKRSLRVGHTHMVATRMCSQYNTIHVPVEGGTVPADGHRDICLFIVIYCPPGAHMRHLATNKHTANGGPFPSTETQ